MKVRYRQRALDDIEQIHSYLTRRSPAGAGNVLRAIHAAILQITEQPNAAERTSDPSIRVKFVGRYRYRIFYEMTEDAVEIIHIRHTSRLPWVSS